MSFRVLDALPMLVIRYSETINKVPSGDRKGLENQKVMGFRTPSGKVLALDVYPNNLEHVRLWIEQTATPKISGVVAHGPKKCADLRRSELNSLADAKGLYLEVETAKAFEDLLNWYA
jgi:hypothetical protein